MAPAEALADAREFLHGEIERRGGSASDEQIGRLLIERFGSPEDVAAAYAAGEPPVWKLFGCAPGWRAECVRCGRSAPAGRVGVIRIGARSYGKWTIGWCRRCRFFSVIRFVRDMPKAVLLALLVAAMLANHGFAVEPDPREKLDSTARMAIRAVPFPWQVARSNEVPVEQARAIGMRLGAKVERLSNAVLSAFGGTAQVNTIVCSTAKDSETIAAALRKVHKDQDRVIANGKVVIELVGLSDELCRRASYELGLRPMPEAFRWRVAFDAAPIETCRDPMAWNRFYNAFLRRRAGDASAEREIAELAPSFTFGKEMTLGCSGTSLTVTPFTEKFAASSGQVRYTFAQLPQTAGVPTAHVEGTVTIPAPSGVKDPPGPALTAATPFWPADDAEIKSLASKITAGRDAPKDQVNAIAGWIMPGTNVRYGGPLGSRLGVKECVKKGEGRCWDFSDLFITLCRASGIPARQAYGWLYGADGHVWAEVHLPERGWVQVDPTGGPKPLCGPFHIAWAISDSAHLPLVYLSKPQITLETP